MRVVFVGGGSGGHFYPLIAIAEALKVRDEERHAVTDLYYMGPDIYNEKALESQNITFVYCPAGKQRVYRSWRNFTDKFKIFAGIFVAFWKLYWLYPDVIMSKGGYTSVPIVFAAWLLRIPIVIHESDAVAGRANMFAARFARYIGIAHDDVANSFPKSKVALVGMPMRKSFFLAVDNPHAVLGVPADRPLIFVTGGSLGADRINKLILNTLDELLPHYTVVHQTGDVHARETAETAATLLSDKSLLNHYFVMGTLAPEQMAAAMQAASLIITRAGSTTIFETALLGKPSIIVPIPEDISRDQRTNAYAYARGGGGTVLEEDNLTDSILYAEINRIIDDKQVYDAMSAAAKNFTVGTAAYTLADTLLGIGQEHEN